MPIIDANTSSDVSASFIDPVQKDAVDSVNDATVPCVAFDNATVSGEECVVEACTFVTPVSTYGEETEDDDDEDKCVPFRIESGSSDVRSSANENDDADKACIVAFCSDALPITVCIVNVSILVAEASSREAEEE